VAFGLVDGALAFVATARFAGWGLGAEAGLAALVSAASAVTGASSPAGASVLATPIVLDRVRWHVSHVTTVRTNVPS
jgi:hypothetical protein